MNIKTTSQKIGTVATSLLCIALVYSSCFWYGRHVEEKAFEKHQGQEKAAGEQVKFADLIKESAILYDIHPALIAAVIHAESNFNPRARSYAGAKGLMQINPPTQRHLRLRNVYDPRQNVDAGTRYLRELMKRFNGNLRLVLAAYNAGPGAVKKYAGIPPYKETRKYVKKVLGYYQHYRQTFVTNPLMS